MGIVDEAAREFCRWYDEYQTEFARDRLRREFGEVVSQPRAETIGAYERMIAAYDALHIAALGEPRPNYIERAKAEGIE